MKRLRRAPPTRQRGFALVVAIFLMVALAGIGAVAVRGSINQRASNDLQLQILRADAALNAGAQYAAARLLSTDKCNTMSKKLESPDGFDIDFSDCNEDDFKVDGADVSIFTLTVTASRGSYGSPDYVSRSVTIRIVNG